MYPGMHIHWGIRSRQTGMTTSNYPRSYCGTPSPFSVLHPLSVEEDTKPPHNTLTPADLVLDWSMGLWVYATAIDWRRVYSNPVIVGWIRHAHVLGEALGMED